MKKDPCGRIPTWGRVGVKLEAAGAAAAGARGAEDQEPRAGEERAQPGWGATSGANFSHRRSGEEWKGGPGLKVAARGSPLAGCGGEALRTPTPSKLDRSGAGGGGAGQVAAACPGWAGAERGFGQS